MLEHTLNITTRNRRTTMSYGTNLNTEPIRKPVRNARVERSTVHQPRNTRKDRSKAVAAILAGLERDEAQAVKVWLR
jgi:hypothetical protein